jgi:hypothetical protein
LCALIGEKSRKPGILNNERPTRELRSLCAAKLICRIMLAGKSQGRSSGLRTTKPVRHVESSGGSFRNNSMLARRDSNVAGLT